MAQELADQGSARMKKKVLLRLNCILLTIGNCGGPLIMRLYYIHGGRRVWLACWLQSFGWPIMLIPRAICYYHRRRITKGTAGDTKFFLMEPSLFVAASFIGLLSCLDNYCFAYGAAHLPVSTSALILASQMTFIAVFAFIIVRQKFTSYSINAVVLLTIGGAVLALHASGDRPKGEPKKEYIKGFLTTVGSAIIYGLIMPLIELTYKTGKQKISYSLILEFQMVMCLFNTIFCTVGMFISKDFQGIPSEAGEFRLGETKYYVVVVWSVIIWQCFFLGATGVIFCASSLFSGIVIAVLLPVTEILAVIFYNERFNAEKGVSLVLSLWGFVSYFYGDIKHAKKKQLNPDEEVPHYQIPSP